jgi:hypothetical protein
MTSFSTYPPAEAEATRRAFKGDAGWTVVEDYAAQLFAVLPIGEETAAYLDAHRSDIAYLICPIN